MAVGRIVEHDPATRRYLLPAEHAATLTRQAAPNNMAPFFQYIPISKFFFRDERALTAQSLRNIFIRCSWKAGSSFGAGSTRPASRVRR